MTHREPARLVVLISGTGRNLQALIDASTRGDLGAQIVKVISNRSAVAGLARAGVGAGCVASLVRARVAAALSPRSPAPSAGTPAGTAPA